MRPRRWRTLLRLILILVILTRFLAPTAHVSKIKHVLPVVVPWIARAPIDPSLSGLLSRQHSIQPLSAVARNDAVATNVLHP